ncbi:MAG: hypothetical protein ABF291_03695 [Desulfobacterales bacterium]
MKMAQETPSAINNTKESVLYTAFELSNTKWSKQANSKQGRPFYLYIYIR